MKVVYLGPSGTFTEHAAIKLFPNEERISVLPIRRVVREVESEKADFGVVPLENFYNGKVRETLDALTEVHKTRIVKEASFPIVHCIGALKEHKEINKIYSKDQAIEQCSMYLCENHPNAETIAMPSTTAAAERIFKEKLYDSAVIASEDTLLKYGLSVFNKDIVPNNVTRFAVLSREYTEPTGDDKSFIVISPPERDKPGVLHEVTGIFKNHGINLEGMFERPNSQNGGYYFYIELSGHEKQENVRKALDEVGFVKVLGSYRNSHWKDQGVAK